MSDRLTRIAIVSGDRCKPKKCRQECKKSYPVVKTGKLCIEVTVAAKIAYISEELCIDVVFVSRNAHLKPSRLSTCLRIWINIRLIVTVPTLSSSTCYQFQDLHKF